MLIPTVIVSEAHKCATDDDMPTLPGSEASKLWCDAAVQLSRKLLECARIKQRHTDVMDMDGAEHAMRFARELLQLSKILEQLPGLQAEMAATIRRQAVDRIVRVYEVSSSLLKLD